LHKSSTETLVKEFVAFMSAAEPLNLDTVGVYGQLASEVTPRRVEWLWEGRIPLGKVTVLDGDPGLGKSALTLDLAARVTTGSPMPDGSHGLNGGVLVLNAEDDEGDTIVPRLAAMGANLKLVRILKTIPGSEGERQLEFPGDLAAIERAARSVQARLIIIDPLMAFLTSATNSFRDQDVRRALAPLAALAERLNVAIVIVRHLNKNSGEGNPLYRGGASIGIIGAARSGLLAANDPDGESGQSRILASTKSNLGLLPPSLRYVIEPHGDSIRVQWCGESEYRAAALLVAPADEEEVTAVEEAEEFLLSILQDGAVWAKEIVQRAKAEGHSEKTLRRAKARLDLKTYHEGFGKEGKWMWELPPKMADPTAQ
jgi:RecA-family ATPase